MNWDVAGDPGLEELLEHIRITRGVNFTGYKRTTVTRRIQKRMEQVHVSTYGEYRDLLEADADEFNALFDTMLINVTSFFRDPAAWDYLAEDVIPSVVSRKAPGEPIRIWSAGCASGQEAYTIAMILADALGGPGNVRQHVKIYATDIDDDALAQARQGVYSQKDVADIPEALLKRYFEPIGDQFLFDGLRRSVIFGRHDLTKDAPIGRLDLLVCRNTLMYFNAEVQTRILNLFHFALEDSGYLFLGKAEMLLSHGRLFTPLSMKNRVFRKSVTSLTKQLPMTQVPDETTTAISLPSLALDVSPVALIAVDLDGVLTEANTEARTMFGLTGRDLGQPLQNLQISHRPVELRSHLEQAYLDRRPAQIRGVKRLLPDGQAQYLDVTLTPLTGPDRSVAGAAISFADVSMTYGLREELQRSREDLDTAYEELRSANEELEATNEELQTSNEALETTNEELQSTNEELETMNEELQSSNEELETTNEELQSSNEELETMNEELSATNEELETTNEALRTRSTEILILNERLESLMSSLSSVVIAIDREMLVELWNDKAEELWGLRQAEVEGKPLAVLDIGLPVGELVPIIRSCLDGATPRKVDALDGYTRTGRPVRLRVMCTPVSGSGLVSGVVLVIDVEED